MHQVKYGLFYDNHTHMENPDMGKDFDPEYFTDQYFSCMFSRCKCFNSDLSAWDVHNAFTL